MGPAAKHLQLIHAVKDPVAEILVSDALDSIDTAYSYSGDVQYDPAAMSYKKYHNGLHTRGVIKGVLKGCELLNITGKERTTIIAAAAYHDYIDDIGVEDGSNEAASLDMLQRRMFQYSGYFNNKKYFDLSGFALLGTRYRIENGKLIQKATEQQYPNKIAEIAAFIVAASDLGSLHAPIGPYTAHRLFEEKTMGTSGKDPNITDMIGFQSAQLTLLDSGYTYPTKQLHKLYATHTAQVYAYSEDTLEQIQAGNPAIETWGQLIERDLAFARKHS